MPVVAGGATRIVRFEDRAEYVDAVIAMRLGEFDAAVDAVRAGLAATLPLPLLSLFTATQLETKICGSVEVDLELLKRNTVNETKRGVPREVWIRVCDRF